MIRVGTFLPILILFVAGSVSVNAQLLSYQSESNVDGWAVPNIKKLKVKRVSASEIGGGVFRKLLFEVAKSKPSILLSKAPENDDYCEFRNLQSYSFKGHVFAIDGACLMFSISRHKSTNGNKTIVIKEYLGAYTRYTFYDEDGDGKFERRYNSRPGDPKFEILIPTWTKK